MNGTIGYADPAADAPAEPAGGPAEPAAGSVEIETPDGRWVPVCGLAQLTPGRGVAALLPGGGQAALFLDRRGRTYAIGNRDPFTGAYVLSRGLLGSTGSAGPFVASPLLKQRFDLTTGRCLDDPEKSVPVYATRHLP
ncbi:nitrite reductase (NAD(P)H) small subunit [Streptomyces hoynatensis]|uniref:Nitrite reductase (NAD(P)H) small subunit n=1 Tax=Streptomyces hoynatensis TaxID=1141874 RepID=A0A3A9ZBU1_9ACTN|nr:nitrite reductase (NAD(P)H) small subunit [Streptomyces hoynatensis]RKN45728.1 nitrite reductase (NAD(P)H) small subunit [Streptomyces hoynatensis]